MRSWRLPGWVSTLRRKIVDERAAKVQEIAGLLGVDPEWLDSVIAFESGHNPQAQNPIPYNQALVDKGTDLPRYARGLIQFIDSSAQQLGFMDSLDLITRLPDYYSQMDRAVLPYFKRMMPFVSKQDMYMSVFYPAFRKVDPDTAFSAKVQKVNPGIVTVQDYIDRVDTNAAFGRILTAAKSPVGVTGLLLFAGVIAYIWFKR
jgi:hypothetical protein